MVNDILDTIDFLIRFADPDGESYERLHKLRDCVVRNVMLGPSARRFIQRLVELHDKIQCRSLRRDGRCAEPDVQRCEYLGMFQDCPKYQPAPKGSLRGDPLVGLGGDHA